VFNGVLAGNPCLDLATVDILRASREEGNSVGGNTNSEVKMVDVKPEALSTLRWQFIKL
jgi:hypothetical protein